MICGRGLRPLTSFMKPRVISLQVNPLFNRLLGFFSRLQSSPCQKLTCDTSLRTVAFLKMKGAQADDNESTYASNSKFPTCQVCSEMYLILPFYQVHIRHTCYALTATYPTMHLGQARAAATESVSFKERTSKYVLENFPRRCGQTLKEQTGSHSENYETSLHPEVEHNFIRRAPRGAFHRLACCN